MIFPFFLDIFIAGCGLEVTESPSYFSDMGHARGEDVGRVLRLGALRET
jgi:hypothetical protein